jgi:Phasin protein
MAGLLAVLESDGGGAQLPLTLPVATAADTPAPAPTAPADTDARPQTQMRVTDAEAGDAPAAAPVFASCANGNDPRPGEIVGAAIAQSPEQNGNGHLPTPAQPPRGSDAASDELRAKALEIVNANVNATLDYARELAQVRSPTEFIALSTSHARRRIELMMTHAAAFGALSHPFAARQPDE